MPITEDTPIEGWRGGLLISDDWTSAWHTSVTGNTAKFRSVYPEFQADKCFDRRTSDGEDALRRFMVGKCYLRWQVLSPHVAQAVPAQPTCNNREAWRTVAEQVISIGAEEFRLDENREKVLVPTTPMRTFYKVLREMSNDEICGAFAYHLQNSTAAVAFLDALISQSVDHIIGCGYCNSVDSLIAARRADDVQDDPEAKSSSDHRAAQALVQHIRRAGGFEVIDHPDLSADYVGREVAPLRTTNGRYENGKSAQKSGGGGMDMLLISRDSRPIVGEIKAVGDRGPMLALVQALAYAVEMRPHSQWARLVYEEDVEPRFDHASGGRLDVYIFVEGNPGNRAEATHVQAIAEQLLTDGRETRNHLQRIVGLCWDPTAPNEGRPRVNLWFKAGD